jgi:hypothetical protein
MQRRTASPPYLADDRQYIGRVLIGERFDGRDGALACFRELRPSELHAARLRRCQRRLRPCANHRPLFLSKRSEQVQDERVYVRAKLSDNERYAVRYNRRERMSLACAMRFRNP